MPSWSSLAPGVASGSPARSRRATAFESPSRRLRASAAASQCPSLVMPIGTTSNFLRSIAFKTEAAESSETSCSPLLPPNKIPTRSFLAIIYQSIRLEQEGSLLRRYLKPCLSPGTRVWMLGSGTLQDLLPKGRAGQFDREIGGAIVLIDYRVDFDDLEAEQAAMIGQDL